MDRRKLRDGVYKMGAIDWDRRLFDSLIPLPDGTSYNCYLIEGSEKVALLDTVDPAMLHVLKRQLDDVPQIDYVIAHHAEQDHSGASDSCWRNTRMRGPWSARNAKTCLLTTCIFQPIGSSSQ